jgi:hypothetical protein
MLFLIQQKKTDTQSMPKIKASENPYVVKLIKILKAEKPNPCLQYVSIFAYSFSSSRKVGAQCRIVITK